MGCSSALIASTTDIRRCAAQPRSSAGSPAVRATSTSSIREKTRPVSSVVSPVFSCRSSGPYERIWPPSRSAPAEGSLCAPGCVDGGRSDGVDQRGPAGPATGKGRGQTVSMAAAIALTTCSPASPLVSTTSPEPAVSRVTDTPWYPVGVPPWPNWVSAPVASTTVPRP